MIEVFRIPISKAQLNGMPAGERDLLLISGHIVNQISVLLRLLIFSTNFKADNDIENKLSAGQSQIILRLLFGTLAEAWEFIRRPANQKLIGNDYIGSIDDEGQKLYSDLKKHFGKSKLLHTLRNTIAFHHPEAAEFEAAFAEVPDDEDWAWYVSEANSNSFYLLSDTIISSRVLKITGEADTAAAFGKIMNEVMNVSNNVTEFLPFLMRAIVAKHFGEKLVNPQPDSGTMIDNRPNLYAFATPFFTEKERPLSNQGGPA
jgi:hypothetical protein